MKQQDYQSIKHNLKTGDLVAFGGRNFVSATIKAKTRSHVSHVGMVLRVNTEQAGIPIIMIIESVSKGVQISRLSAVIANYRGDIWILPVACEIDIPGIEKFMVSKLGIPYDYEQALGSAFDCPLLPDQQEDLSKLFCSELVNEAYSLYVKTDAKIPENSSEQTPIDVCMLPIYVDAYQVAGVLKELS